MCGEDGTDEGEDCPTDGGIEGPAQGAVSRFVGRCIVSTVGNGLLAAPAGRVEYQAEDEEQAWGQKREEVTTPWLRKESEWTGSVVSYLICLLWAVASFLQ